MDSRLIRHTWGELILFAGAAGAAAAPLKLLVHHVFEWTGLAKPFYTELTAFLVLGRYKAMGIVEMAFSELGDMMLGAFFGVVVCFALRHSRPRYHWWLGVGAGTAIWFFSLAFGHLTKITRSRAIDPWSLFAHFLAMISFGLLVVLASRIWRPLRERCHVSED